SANGELAEAEPVDTPKGINTESVLETTPPATAPVPERENKVQTEPKAEPVQPTPSETQSPSGTQLSPTSQNAPTSSPGQLPVQN
ncbi:hypothetical protein ABTL57_19395, partial [Acinetobacter baumannii]